VKKAFALPVDLIWTLFVGAFRDRKLPHDDIPECAGVSVCPARLQIPHGAHECGIAGTLVAQVNLQTILPMERLISNRFIFNSLTPKNFICSSVHSCEFQDISKNHSPTHRSLSD